MKTVREQIKTGDCSKCGENLIVEESETYFVLDINGKHNIETEAVISCENCDVSYTIRFEY